MTTSIFKEKILKSSVLFFTISVFLLPALLLTSCSDSDSTEIMLDDTVLIDNIEKAVSVFVDASSLPSATENVLNGEFADSFIENVRFAEGLGYKIELITDNESRLELKSEIFFSKEGRMLNDTNERRKKKRNRCFEFVFPVDFIMPDDTSITLSTKEDWILIKEWYAENSDVKERPDLVFPIDVYLEDGTIQTLLDRDELRQIKNSCKKGKDKRKCFKLVFPVIFTMPDSSVITVNERVDFKLLRKWHKANPDVTEKGSLIFPVNIEYKNGTAATINDQTEFDAAKEACEI
jgi:hypothetical protein